MTYPPKVEILIEGTWEDVTERARRAGNPVIRRGRADETSRVQPTSMSTRLDNEDGWLTPGNPMSPWYPHVDLGTQARVSVEGVTPFLLVPRVTGAGVSTPDHASLDITGDIHLRAEIVIDEGDLHENRTIAAKSSGAGTRSWFWFISDSGHLGLQWSTDGTALTAPVSLIPLSIPSGTFAVGVKLDVNNGSGQHVVTFETAPSLAGPWTDFSTETRAGTTSIFSGSAAVIVGNTGIGTLPFGERVRKLEIRNGINGTVVANPDFTARPVGTAGFTDSAGRTWSFQGAASVSKLRTRFRGEISQIAPHWPHPTTPTGPDPGVAHVEINADGVLRRMAQGDKALQSALRRLVLSPQNIGNVLAYWPLEDGSAATEAASPIDGVSPMVIGGGIRFAGDSDPFAGSDSLVSISADQPAGWNGSVPPPPSSLTAWGVEWFVKVPTKETDPESTVLGLIYTSGTIRRWRFAVSSTNITVRGYDADGTELETGSFSSSGFPTEWTALRFDAVQNGGNIDWDLSFWEIGSDSVAGMSGSVAGTLGRPTRLANLFTSPPDGMSIGHMIVTYDLALGWLSPADRGWVGEAAGDRIERLCGEEGISIQIVGDPGDTAAMGPQRPSTLLDLLYEAADADMGILGDQRGGTGLRYRTRTSLYNQTAALTLDASDRGVIEPFAPVRSDQRIRNDVTATRTDGSSYRAVDEGSIEKHGRYDEDLEVNVESDSQLPAIAGWRRHQGTWDELRYEAISTQMGRVPDLLDTWLDVDFGDRIEVVNLPRQHHGDVDQLIEHYEEQFPFFQLPAVITVSPAKLWDVGILDGDGTPDASLERLDTDGSELFLAVDADDTVFQVQVTDGPGWTTDADYYPMDLILGGEVVTATSCVFFGVYVFTVTRAVNGVEKSHLAGAAINVADPIRLAL